MNLFDLVTGCWALQPAKLLELQAVYATHLRGEKIDIAAIEARLGRPLHSEQQAYSVRDGGVGVLSMSGILAPKANIIMQICGGLSTQMATKQLESMAADPRVRSIVLALDSPGGSVIGTPEFGAAVRQLAQVKPLVVHSDGILASAAYWVGSAANSVYISGSTVEVGSIGVVAVHRFDPRASDTTTEITAGRYKRIASNIAPLTEEGRADIQAKVDYVYGLFIDAVAQHRGVTAEHVVEHMADGRVFLGQQAIDAGLVDGVSTLDDLVDQLAAKPEAFAARRQTLVAVAGPATQPAGAQAGPPAEPVPLATTPATQGDPMDRATLAQQHPELLAALQSEFTTAGATAERDRVAAVRAQTLPGHEALIERLATDGKTTGPEAAAAVLGAERTARAAAVTAHASDAPSPVPHANAPAVDGGDKPTATSIAASAIALFRGTTTQAKKG
jgi:signal peptide peptidase SppA